jgi:hypothetical protein
MDWRHQTTQVQARSDPIQRIVQLSRDEGYSQA